MDENLNQSDTNEASPNFKDTFRKQLSPGSSSQSSFTSDIDSALSTPLDENKSFETSVRIKQLISTFETRQAAGLPKSDSHLPPDRFQGIEEVKMSLQKTMEKCFSQEATKDSSDELDQRERKVSVDTIINKFQTYIKTMPKYEKPLVNRDDRLFYCCLVVGWDCEKPQIKLKFPPNVTCAGLGRLRINFGLFQAKIPDRMEDLCYPEAASGPLDISDNAQCYSLVITNDKGERTFGYCRRVIPEGSTRCIPLAYCILSKHRAPRFYKKILAELESRHGIPDKLRDELIAAFYNNKFPRPGESIKINLADVIGDSNCARPRHRDCDLPDLRSFVHVNFNGGYGTLNGIRKTSDYENMVMCRSWPLIVEDDGNTELLLTLHHDTRYEEADLKPLHQLPADILLKIFASLLLERKVVLISCVISKLSCCVEALQSILYPFSWPHTFIPILPQCLWDVVESPTPVICGILSVSVVNDHKIEHGIVVDLDEGTIVCEEGDEDNILSDSMKKSWRQGIRLAERESPDRYVHSVYLSDAYLKVFIDSLKHYKNHINGNNFEKESFIRGGRTKGIRRFLKWFTETTMFLSFIDSVTTNPESFTLFDQKIEMYGSDESNLIVTKLLEWKK
jgi:hypothetical protein